MARWVYVLAGLRDAPDRIDLPTIAPIGDLVCMLLGRADGFRLAEVGPAPGRARVFYSPSDEGRPYEAVALYGQSRQGVRLGCAHGCAQIAAWTAGRVYPASTLVSIAQAVLVPEASLHHSELSMGQDAHVLAAHYGVDHEVIVERQSVLRRRHRSSEWPAAFRHH